MAVSYIYYCGQESLRRNGVAIIVNKSLKHVLGYSLKNNRMISVCFQDKSLNITVIQAYAPTSNTEEAEVERFYEDLQDLLKEVTPKKDVLFIIGDWNAQVGSQEAPGVTGKFGLGVQNEAGQRLTVLPRECTDYSRYPYSTTEDSTCGQHQMVNIEIRLTVFFAAKDGEALYSQQKQDQELTGSDQELLIAKFRLKLKKVGKTTRPFRYDLNQTP